MSTSLSPRFCADASAAHLDEQPDTLPEGVPVDDLEDLRIEIVSALSALSDEAPAESRLPTRKGFDEEPTRKQHAPRPPKEELTNVTDLHELFEHWQN